MKHRITWSTLNWNSTTRGCRAPALKPAQWSNTISVYPKTPYVDSGSADASHSLATHCCVQRSKLFAFEGGIIAGEVAGKVVLRGAVGLVCATRSTCKAAS